MSTNAFKNTMWIQLFLSSIALMFLHILIMGLLKPFVDNILKLLRGRMSGQQDQDQQQQYVSYILYF